MNRSYPALRKTLGALGRLLNDKKATALGAGDGILFQKKKEGEQRRKRNKIGSEMMTKKKKKK